MVTGGGAARSSPDGGWRARRPSGTVRAPMDALPNPPRACGTPSSSTAGRRPACSTATSPAHGADQRAPRGRCVPVVRPDLRLRRPGRLHRPEHRRGRRAAGPRVHPVPGLARPDVHGRRPSGWRCWRSSCSCSAASTPAPRSGSSCPRWPRSWSASGAWRSTAAASRSVVITVVVARPASWAGRSWASVVLPRPGPRDGAVHRRGDAARPGRSPTSRCVRGSSLMADIEARDARSRRGPPGGPRRARAEADRGGGGQGPLLRQPDARDPDAAQRDRAARPSCSGTRSSTPDQRPAGGRAQARARRNLVTLVNAMLDHARLRAGHVTARSRPRSRSRARRDRTLDLLFRAQAADKGLDFTVTVADDVPAWIEVGRDQGAPDRRQPRRQRDQVHRPGLGVGHGRAGAARSPRHTGPRLVVRVADTGAGIAPDIAGHRLRAVRPGRRDDLADVRGNRLGLTIARQLADLLGGTAGGPEPPRRGVGVHARGAAPGRGCPALGAGSGPRPIDLPAAGVRVCSPRTTRSTGSSRRGCCAGWTRRAGRGGRRSRPSRSRPPGPSS